LLILVYGPRYACIGTIGLRTVPAQKRKGNRATLLHRYPGWWRYLFLEGLYDVPGSGMFHLAVNLTEVASYTDIFDSIDSFHFVLRIDR